MHFETAVLNNLQARDLIQLSVISALALLSRLDNIFLIIILGIWLLFPVRRVRFLVMGDLVIAVISVFLAFVSRLGIDLYYFYSNAAVVMFSTSLVVKPIVYYAFGLYKQPVKSFKFNDVFKIIVAVLTAGIIVAVGMTVMSYLDVFPRFPRLALVLDLAFSFPLIAIWHWLGWRPFRWQDGEFSFNTPRRIFFQ